MIAWATLAGVSGIGGSGVLVTGRPARSGLSDSSGVMTGAIAKTLGSGVALGRGVGWPRSLRAWRMLRAWGLSWGVGVGGEWFVVRGWGCWCEA